MTAEPIGNNTYKITLDTAEAAQVPQENDSHGMDIFIHGLIDSLWDIYGINIPEGKLLAEVFLRSDGSCVFFLTAMEHEPYAQETAYYCCDINGVHHLLALCAALADTRLRCAIYHDEAERFRIIFTDPPPGIHRICTEFGDFSEISQLFAARSEEYLTEIMPYGDIDTFAAFLK